MIFRKNKIKRYYIIICFWVSFASAAPVIGTTELLYGESKASDVLLVQLDKTESNQMNHKLVIRRAVLSEVVRQIATYQNLLNATLGESGSFSIYNADPVIQLWKNTNPQILDTYYKTTSIETDVSTSNNSDQRAKLESAINNNNTEKPHKFILIGWVDNIHEVENRTPISNTGKTSVLYSLDISCEYRLINADTSRVAASFVAMGHAGIARVLGSAPAPISYDVKVVVNDMFNSLAQNVRHVLQLREDEYIKRKNNAARVRVESAVLGK